MSTLEPPKVRDLETLDPEFRVILAKLLLVMDKAKTPFRVDETWRSQARQAWLFASGRTRPGKKLTDKDGQINKSQHQLGLAADLYPVRPDGKVYIPPGDNQVWDRLATAARSLGLRSGRDWSDSPHVELRRSAAQREE